MGSTINLVQVVQDAGHDDFGFLVIRKSYGDEALWEQWAEAFNNLVEKSVVEHAGAEGVIDKLMMAMIDDPELHNSSWFDIQRFYDECQDNDMSPPGTDVGFCLVADHEAMNSLLHPNAGEEPWIWAVDTEHDFEKQDTAAAYPGYFKLAIASAVPFFYPVIAGSSISGPELYSSARPIWKRAI